LSAADDVVAASSLTGMFSYTLTFFTRAMGRTRLRASSRGA
jgi:hypothetical protein